jgi:hypothetical protein
MFTRVSGGGGMGLTLLSLSLLELGIGTRKGILDRLPVRLTPEQAEQAGLGCGGLVC